MNVKNFKKLFYLLPFSVYSLCLNAQTDEGSIQVYGSFFILQMDENINSRPITISNTFKKPYLLIAKIKGQNDIVDMIHLKSPDDDLLFKYKGDNKNAIMRMPSGKKRSFHVIADPSLSSYPTEIIANLCFTPIPAKDTNIYDLENKKVSSNEVVVKTDVIVEECRDLFIRPPALKKEIKPYSKDFYNKKYLEIRPTNDNKGFQLVNNSPFHIIINGQRFFINDINGNLINTNLYKLKNKKIQKIDGLFHIKPYNANIEPVYVESSNASYLNKSNKSKSRSLPVIFNLDVRHDFGYVKNTKICYMNNRQSLYDEINKKCN